MRRAYKKMDPGVANTGTMCYNNHIAGSETLCGAAGDSLFRVSLIPVRLSSCRCRITVCLAYEMKKRAEYLECGKIINTHGTDGTLKLESWCDAPEVLAGLGRLFIKIGDEYCEYPVEKGSVFKNFVLAKLDRVSDLETARGLKNTVVYAAREDIPLEEGAHFIADLIGLQVIDADSRRVYGEIVDVINRGASDIYVIRTETGESMMPAVAEFVVEIDLDRGVFVRPIEGMF